MRAPDRAAAIAAVLACAIAFTAGSARADGTFQFLPEVDAFLTMNERARVYLYSALTFGHAPPGAGGTLRLQDGEVGAHIDYSLTPILRPQLQQEDWARNRYLWLRAGYNRARSLGEGESANRFRENRGVFELNARTLPLAGEIELTGRARVDVRDRNDDASRRYRLRLGAERMFDAGGRAIVAYAEAENIYDTRYNSWNQQRYKAGAEIALSRGWRVEPYFLLIRDSRADPENTRALGLVLKLYR